MTDELGSIVQSFRALEDEFKDKALILGKKTAEIETLKDLSDLSYMTLNADYLLFIALERALKLVDADIGSVMILSRPQKDTFVIKASIGHGDHAKKGTVTTFDDSSSPGNLRTDGLPINLKNLRMFTSPPSPESRCRHQGPLPGSEHSGIFTEILSLQCQSLIIPTSCV